jgi:hypothetical protein
MDFMRGDSESEEDAWGRGLVVLYSSRDVQQMGVEQPGLEGRRNAAGEGRLVRDTVL